MSVSVSEKYPHGHVENLQIILTAQKYQLENKSLKKSLLGLKFQSKPACIFGELEAELLTCQTRRSN
jgi:hypothetical protein